MPSFHIYPQDCEKRRTAPLLIPYADYNRNEGGCLNPCRNAGAASTPRRKNTPRRKQRFSRLQNSGTSFKRTLRSSAFRPLQKKLSSALNSVPAFKVRSPPSSPVSSLKLCFPPPNFAPSFKSSQQPQTPPRQSDSACSNKSHLLLLHTSLKINFPVKFCKSKS